MVRIAVVVVFALGVLGLYTTAVIAPCNLDAPIEACHGAADCKRMACM